MPNITVFIC